MESLDPKLLRAQFLVSVKFAQMELTMAAEVFLMGLFEGLKQWRYESRSVTVAPDLIQILLPVPLGNRILAGDLLVFAIAKAAHLVFH